MILSLEQETQLARVERADIAWREVKRTAVARALKAAEADIAAADALRVVEAGKARDLGIPARTIGTLGLSTKDPKTVRAVLARSVPGAALEDAQHATDVTPGYWFERIGNSGIVLTLHGEPFAASAREHGWSANDFAAITNVHDWYLDADGFAVAESDYIPELGKRHPVGAWHAANLRIARDWAANN